MFLVPADYAIDLPTSAKPVKSVVFNQRIGFEVQALKTISYHAAREMNWSAGISIPAYGYLFVDTRAGPKDGDMQHVVVGAAFFGREVQDDVDAEWFLTGVWLHPSARGQGWFIRSLPEMEKAFGHFAICGPYSEGFKALMSHHPEVASHTVEQLVVSTG